MSCSKLSLVSSLKSPLSHSQRLLLELTFVLFAPWPGMQMCLCICEGESEAKMVLSPISLGAPSLSCHHSLAPGTRHSCGGTTLWGTFVSICLQFKVAPIQSSGCACHKPKSRAKACFKGVEISGDQYNISSSLGWQNVFDCFIYFVSRFLFIFAFTVFILCFDLFFSDLPKVPLKYSYDKICLSIVNITAFKIFRH